MYRDNLILWTVYIVGGFLLGSCMFSQILPKLLLGVDVTECSEDHNPGCTNVFRTCGPVWGVVCLALDLLKGFLPVYLSCRILDSSSFGFALVLAAPVLGHALAPLNHFQGGKCIATSFGALLGLLPLSRVVFLLAGIYIVFSTVVKVRDHRQRSMLVFGLFGVSSVLLLVARQEYPIALGCLLIAATAMWKHSRMFLTETVRS